MSGSHHVLSNPLNACVETHPHIHASLLLMHCVLCCDSHSTHPCSLFLLSLRSRLSLESAPFVWWWRGTIIATVGARETVAHPRLECAWYVRVCACVFVCGVSICMCVCMCTLACPRQHRQVCVPGCTANAKLCVWICCRAADPPRSALSAGQAAPMGCARKRLSVECRPSISAVLNWIRFGFTKTQNVEPDLRSGNSEENIFVCRDSVFVATRAMCRGVVGYIAGTCA